MDETIGILRSFTEAQDSHRQLLKERREHADEREFLDRAAQFVETTKNLGSITDGPKDREGLQALLDYWVSVLYRAGVDVNTAILADFDLSTQPELADQDCPYVGLAKFTASEAQHFHGRKHVVEQLLARLRRDQVVVIVGRPGSGVSSIVAAGLIPEIKSGSLAEMDEFQVLPITWPGTAPVAALPEQVTRGGGVEAGGDDKQAGIDHPLLLVIDNLDEIYALCTSAELRLEFMHLLERFITAPGSRNRLVLLCSVALSDSIADETNLATTWLREQFASKSYRVPPMTLGELRAAIVEPARRVGLQFDPGVPEDLVNDVFGEPAALPLLQFSLSRLWKYRTRNRISRETYTKLGGGRRALGMAAEEIWTSLDPNAQEVCRHILTRLVQLDGSGPGVETGEQSDGMYWAGNVRSQRLSVEALQSDCPHPGVFNEVLERLLQEGLLKAVAAHGGADYSVEIAHEALFQWQRYGNWLDQGRHELRNARWLEDQARKYEAYGQLLNDRTLAHAQFCRDQVGARQLSAGVAELITTSEAAIEDQARAAKRRNRWLWLFIGTLATLLAATLHQKKAVEESIAAAGRGVDNLSARLAYVQNIAVDARRALEKANVVLADTQLATIEQASAEMIVDIKEFSDEFLNRNFSSIAPPPESKTLLVASISSDTGDALWEPAFWGMASANTGSRSELALATGNGKVLVLKLNGTDGKSAGEWLRVIPPTDTTSGRQEATGINSAIVNDVAYDAQGNYLAAGGTYGKISVWDRRQTGAKPRWFCSIPNKEIGRVYSIKMGSVGGRIKVAAGLDTDVAAVWDLERDCIPGAARQPEQQFPTGGDVYAIDLHPVRPFLATGGADQVARVWALEGDCPTGLGVPGNPLCIELSGHKGAIFSVHFDPVKCSKPIARGEDSPCRLLTSSADRTLRVWSTQSGEQVATRTRPRAQQLGMARFSPDGRWVAVASEAGAVFFWSTESLSDLDDPVFTADNLSGPVFGLTFDNSCGSDCEFRLYAGSFGGRITRIELPGQTRIAKD